MSLASLPMYINTKVGDQKRKKIMKFQGPEFSAIRVTFESLVINGEYSYGE